MSEKPSSPESAKSKHKSFLGGARFELGSIFGGVLTGALGLKILTLLGMTNPVGLFLGWAASALAGHQLIRNAE